MSKCLFSSSSKSKPKPATANKTANNTSATRGGRAGRGRRGRNPGRGKPKTVEELDAEMVDYFANDAPAEGTAPANGAVQQANGGEDLGMAEISVSCLRSSMCNRSVY